MISVDPDVKQKLFDVNGDVPAAERKLVAAERKLAAAEKKWMDAKEESVKEHYFRMMDLAQKAVDHYQTQLFSLDYGRRDEKIQNNFSNEGWEPRAPSEHWENKLTYFSSRDDMINSIISYIRGVKSPERSPERLSVLSQGPHGKGFAICSTLGIMGMGKTVCLFTCLFVSFTCLFVSLISL